MFALEAAVARQLLTPIALGILSEVFGFSWAFFMVGTVLLGVTYVVYRLRKR